MNSMIDEHAQHFRYISRRILPAYKINRQENEIEFFVLLEKKMENNTSTGN